MKKALFTLSMLALLCAVMMIGVSAAVSDSGIGTYIRFDNQATIDAHIGENGVRASFDAEEGALSYIALKPEEKTVDTHMWIFFDKPVYVDDYPYLRITYRLPKKTSWGADTPASLNFFSFLNVHGGYGAYTHNLSFTAKQSDVAVTQIFDVRTLSDYNKDDENTKYITDIRADFPNDMAAGQNVEFYIYDVGMFNEYSVYTYHPLRDYYLLDFTNPDEAAKWSFKASGKGDSTVTYSAEEGATVFSHGSVDSGATDVRIMRDIEQDKWFNPADYPYFSIKAKTNFVPGSFRNLDVFRMPNGGGNKTTIYGDAPREMFAGKTANDYTIAYKSIAAASEDLAGTIKAADSIAFVTHQWDPIDTSSATGTETVTFKYAAFYATEAEAKLEAQFAPKGLAGVMPAAKGAKGKITGVNDTMEYRVSGVGEYTAVPAGATEVEVDAGKTYDVRYKAKEGFNPGLTAQIGIPHYVKFTIDDITTVEGETITNTGHNQWNVLLPFGTDLSKIKMKYTAEVDTPAKYNYYRTESGKTTTSYYTDVARPATALMLNGDMIDASQKTIASDSTEFEVKVGQNVFALRSRYAVYEIMTVNFELDIKSDADGAQLLADLAAAKNPELYLCTTETEINAAAKSYVENIVLNGYSGYTLAVTSEILTAPVAGTKNDIDGTDGIAKITYSVTYGAATKSATIEEAKIDAKAYPIVLNFDEKLINELVFYGAGTGENFKYGLFGEMIETAGAVDGRAMKVTKDDTIGSLGEFNFTVYFGSGSVPAIEDLSEYTVLVYNYKVAKGGSNQLYYYTQGFTSGNPRQEFSPSASTGTWMTQIVDVNLKGLGHGTAAGDYTWNNKVKRMRFDFMRGPSDQGKELVIDYIALFPTRADAEAFVNAEHPTVSAELKGVQLRTDKQAIRFGATALFDGWEDKVSDISYGTVVTSQAILGDKLADATVADGEKIADVKGTTPFAEDDNARSWTAAITNIPAGQENTVIVATPYIKYDFNGFTYYYYLKPMSASLNQIRDYVDSWLIGE